MKYQTTRKLWMLLLTAALLALLFLPAALAEETLPSVHVTLGDGEPIGYFDGFEGNFLKSADSVKGVTGRLSLSYEVEGYITQNGQRKMRVDLENVTLTDDVMVLYYRLSQDEPIQYEADLDFLRTWCLPEPMFQQRSTGRWGVQDVLYQEGHPIDDKSLYCLYAVSLAEPIQDGEELIFGAQWDQSSMQYAGGTVVTIDCSHAEDPTVAYTPGTELQLTYNPWAGEAERSYHMVIDRVAFTPFGNRMVIRSECTDDLSAVFPLYLTDDQGDRLTTYSFGERTPGNASKTRPEWVENDVWFFGGENSASLTLTPMLSTDDREDLHYVRTAVPLSDLPGKVTFADGTDCEIVRLDLQPEGMRLWYLPGSHLGYLDFELGDENGDPISNDVIGHSANTGSVAEGLLGYGCYWTAEYKGQYVSMLTEEELAQAKTLVISHHEGLMEQDPEHAFTVPLSR